MRWGYRWVGVAACLTCRDLCVVSVAVESRVEGGVMHSCAWFRLRPARGVDVVHGKAG